MRTIAEILAYSKYNQKELNPKIFDDHGEMYPEVSSKILQIVDTFLDFTRIKDRIKILDVRLVGSNASYNYSDTSDLDIHLIVDLSTIADPEIIAQLYFQEVKHAFKESYDIKIRGIEVELYVEDVQSSAITAGVYSVLQYMWIKFPESVPEPTRDQYERAEILEEEILEILEKAMLSSDRSTVDFIIEELYVMRKNGLDREGETAPENLVFKSLRNKNILSRAKEFLKQGLEKELSLENKENGNHNSELF